MYYVSQDMIYKSIPFQEEDLCLAPRILLSLGMTHHEKEVVGDGGEPNLWCPIRRREAQQATHLDHLAPQPATANFFHSLLHQNSLHRNQQHFFYGEETTQPAH
jgi:hypothetical protein